MRGRATGDGFAVQSTAGSYTVPAGVLPTSYWRRITPDQTRLLDTQNGVLIGVTARKTGLRRSRIAGREMDVRVYELSGDLTSRLGYSAGGEWVDLEFDARGSRIAYRRDAPPSNVTLSPSGTRSAS